MDPEELYNQLVAYVESLGAYISPDADELLADAARAAVEFKDADDYNYRPRN